MLRGRQRILPDPTQDPMQMDGVVGSISPASIGQLSGQLSKMTLAPNPTSTVPDTKTALVPTQTSEVNSVQSTQPKNPQQPGGNNNNNKNNNTYTEQGIAQTQNANAGGNKDKRKVKFPCKICGGNHLTHHCPRMDEVHKYLALLQGAPPQPAVFTNPFPPQQQQMVAANTAPPQEGMTGHPQQ